MIKFCDKILKILPIVGPKLTRYLLGLNGVMFNVSFFNHFL